MPTSIANVTKATARQELAWRVGSWWNTSTTGAGTTTTGIFASLIGFGDDYFDDVWFLLLTSGTNAGEWRRITGFTSSTGTITVVTAFTNAVASGVTAEIHKFPPHLFTLAVNEGSLLAYPAVNRPVYNHLLGESGVYSYGVPRNMRDVIRVLRELTASEDVDDNFDRADSATTAGSDYTAQAGTFGISSNELYSVTDADADLLTRRPPQRDPDISDGVWEVVVRGTLNSATVYRSPALVFRYVDSSNYLVVRLRNALVDLRKVDGGTESSLDTEAITTTDGVDYKIRVQAIDSWIRVWVDDVERITYELLGTDTKYNGYDTYGFRLDKGGSPATAARWDDSRVHKIVPAEEVRDWEQLAGRRSIRIGPRSSPPYMNADRFLILEGRQTLSALGADTTYGTLATDSTAVLEIEVTDPAWEVLMAYAAYALYRTASQPHEGGELTTRQEYLQKAQEWLQTAEMMRARHYVPTPVTRIQFGGW